MHLNRDARERALRVELRSAAALSVRQIDGESQIAERDDIGLQQVGDREDVVDHRAVESFLFAMELQIESQRIVQPG